jgi:hypothetical protein
LIFAERGSREAGSRVIGGGAGDQIGYLERRIRFGIPESKLRYSKRQFVLSISVSNHSAFGVTHQCVKEFLIASQRFRLVVSDWEPTWMFYHPLVYQHRKSIYCGVECCDVPKDSEIFFKPATCEKQARREASTFVRDVPRSFRERGVEPIERTCVATTNCVEEGLQYLFPMPVRKYKMSSEVPQIGKSDLSIARIKIDVGLVKRWLDQLIYHMAYQIELLIHHSEFAGGLIDHRR